MGSIVQLPGEMTFILGTLGAFVRAIKGIWETVPDWEDAKARAAYLLGQIDIRKWAASAGPGNEKVLRYGMLRTHSSS